VDRAYLVADRAVYPSIWRVREELPEVQDDDIFETILSLVLDGIIARPQPLGVRGTRDRGLTPARTAPCGR
jgi:hypothetical protein